jgi:lipocalin-like protein
MRRFLRTVATAASVLAVTACSDITGVRGDVVGTYELQTINGQFLPVTFNDPQFGAVTFVYGEVELDSNGSFVDLYQYRRSGSSFVETDQTFGTWTRSGNTIEFQTDAGDFYTMERTSNNRLVQNSSGVTLVYQR